VRFPAVHTVLLTPDWCLHQKCAVYCWFMYIWLIPWTSSLLILNHC